MKRISSVFLTNRFFLGMAILVASFAACFFLPPIGLFVCQLAFLAFLVLTLTDVAFLFSSRKVFELDRSCASILSLGSENVVKVKVKNRLGSRWACTVLDELPPQLQIRDFRLDFTLKAFEEKELHYRIVPKTRGLYSFGDLLVYFSSPLGLAQRQVRQPAETKVQVYPSVIEMKKHQLIATQRLSTQSGIRRIRRIGHSYDFDHIKEYARGDDPRSINWKATSKLNRLMVNHFEDQKSQQVYSVVDMGRNMSSHFDQMSLLDYCVNASLVLSRIVLQKDDKAGLLTIGDNSHFVLPAERGSVQLNKMMSSLYNITGTEGDANLDRLYQLIRKHIRIRSLLMYFTNIESLTQLERLLPVLERIQSRHLLVVILFENAEVDGFTKETKTTVSGIYAQTIARKYLFEKQQIAHRLRKSGIYTILTQPKDLTINSINQYLEFKARGLI